MTWLLLALILFLLCPILLLTLWCFRLSRRVSRLEFQLTFADWLENAFPLKEEIPPKGN